MSLFFNIIHKETKVNQKKMINSTASKFVVSGSRKAFVTGGTGFIGSHLTEELIRRGYYVKCFIRKTSNLQWLKNLNIELVQGDLFSDDVLQKALEDVDYVYHIAGVVASKTKEGYYQGNQAATRTLLDACIRANPSLKKFVHVSSLSAVGPSLDGKPVDETTPYHPITTYGKSKMAAEMECVQRFGKLPITIVRPPAVYGPRDNGLLTVFHAVKMGIMPQMGFSEKFASLVHVSDLINGITLAGESSRSAGQTYFISNKEYYSWDKIGEIAARVMKKKAIRLKVPVLIVYGAAAISGLAGHFSKKANIFNLEKGRDIVQKAWTCDITKARNELGYQPVVPIEEGIERTVRWYKEQGWL
jgi:nucleoside-diphosphate-sugar epimerase